ncbi:MAG: hypothetical protein KGJ89_05625 [Patescibacteria group bacterium]|nr:hypothetical protein [Patescibacteria group bacterium]
MKNLNVINLKTPLDRELQQARLAYKNNPTLANFEKFRAVYSKAYDLLMEKEAQNATATRTN